MTDLNESLSSLETRFLESCGLCGGIDLEWCFMGRKAECGYHSTVWLERDFGFREMGRSASLAQSNLRHTCYEGINANDKI